MPYFNNSALNKIVPQFQNGAFPNFLFGFQDNTTAPFNFYISNVTVTSNVVTANGIIGSGGGGHDYVTGAAPVPVANAIMGVFGTSTSNGNLNVNPTTIISTSINTSTGLGNIVYKANGNNANATVTVDSGTIVVQPYAYPDTLKVGASIEIGQKFSPDDNDASRVFFVQCKFPTAPQSCNVVLQVSNFNEDATFTTVLNEAGTNVAAQVVGNVVVQSSAEYKFITAKFMRLAVTDVTNNTNASSTIVGTIFG